MIAGDEVAPDVRVKDGSRKHNSAEMNVKPVTADSKSEVQRHTAAHVTCDAGPTTLHLILTLLLGPSTGFLVCSSTQNGSCKRICAALDPHAPHPQTSVIRSRSTLAIGPNMCSSKLILLKNSV